MVDDPPAQLALAVGLLLAQLRPDARRTSSCSATPRPSGSTNVRAHSHSNPSCGSLSGRTASSRSSVVTRAIVATASASWNTGWSPDSARRQMSERASSVGSPPGAGFHV